MSNLIHIKNVSVVEENQYYLSEYNYVGGTNAEMLKFELWVDATDLETYEQVPTEILGFQFTILSVAGAILTPLVFNSTSGNSLNITINNEKSKIAHASATAIVDYDPSNDGVPTFIGIDKLIGTFYYYTNGADYVETLLHSLLVVTDKVNVEPSNFSFSWVRPDGRTYTKDPALPDGIVGSTYEAVSDVSDWTSGNYYLLELATGKLFNTTKTGSLAAEYYNCGYTCSYLVLTNWALGTEVIEFNRPLSLYAPESTVANPVYTLT